MKREKFKKGLLFLLIPALISAVIAGCSKKAEVPFAVIEEISGEVYIMKDGKKIKAEKGIKIFEGDEIITEKKSSAEISYNKNKIKIHEKSKLSVRKLKFDAASDERNSEFYLSEGKISADSSENTGRKNRLTISSPDSTADASDSKFVMSSQYGETKIESKKGSVETTSIKSGRKTTIGTGQKFYDTKNVIQKLPPKKIVQTENTAQKPGVEVPKVK